jgi:hypothetical protein
MREFSYICETYSNPSEKLWTQPNGLCWIGPEKYKDSTWNMQNPNLSSVDICIYLIRCSLSGGLELSCPCDGTNCVEVLKAFCKEDFLYQYPYSAVIHPWLLHFYGWTEARIDPKPTLFFLNGSIKCPGYHLKIIPATISPLTFNRNEVSYRKMIESKLCVIMRTVDSISMESSHQYPKDCWNGTRTYNDRPYAFYDVCNQSRECISQYRIGDGFMDCYAREDENVQVMQQIDHCLNIRNHRFQCSHEHMTCLPISEIGQLRAKCENGNDIFVRGTNKKLANIVCQKRGDSGCLLLRYYIGNSSMHNLTLETDMYENGLQDIPILSHFKYCDSFWDDRSHMDENSKFCREWICPYNMYQCLSGQCIYLDWVCDGEWDCSDASDEEAIVLVREWSDHNRRISGLDQRKQECTRRYTKSKMAFSDLCNVTIEYPCYLASAVSPLDIHTFRPCINLTQIGDGIIDCYAGVDEKNTLENCEGTMLGLTLRCGNYCDRYNLACNSDSKCSNSLLCAYKSKNKTCSGAEDVICLNGTCVEGARCDGFKQCLHGEDEYWCSLHSDGLSRTYYRHEKIGLDMRTFSFRLSFYPPASPTESYDNQSALKAENADQHGLLLNAGGYKTEQVSGLNDQMYLCNRGIPILYTDRMLACFCPPAYYGYRCEFFSDRLTIITHLDLTTISAYPTSIFEIVARLVYGEQTIDHHIFYVNPMLESSNYIKTRFYLLFSRSSIMLDHKKWRYLNRTDIVKNHPYSVRFDVYALQKKEISELGSFHYPIYFDYLPAFRLATVLKFPFWFENSTFNPCAQNSCSPNSVCKPVLNKKQHFYCSCESGYKGENCTVYDDKCSSYCSSDSICRSGQRGMIKTSDIPLCICPLGGFGPSCHIRNNACKSNPCGLNATCHLTFDPSGDNSIICECSKEFYGDRCQHKKIDIIIDVNMTSTGSISIAQFYHLNIDLNEIWTLKILYQKIIHELPATIHYSHDESTIVVLSLLKVYEGFSKPQYFILYFQPPITSLKITSTPYYCPSALSLLDGKLV